MATAKNGQFISGANLEGTTCDWFCIQIQFNDLDAKETKEECHRIYNYFANGGGACMMLEIMCICHLKDLDDCANNHVHIFLAINRRMRLITMLNRLSKEFGYNPFAISIDRCNLKYGYLRYILHIDGNVEGKHEYAITDMITNVSYELLSTYIDSEDDKLTSERLKEIAMDCDFDKMKIMDRIGIDAYKKYRSCITDVCDCEYRLRQDKKPTDLLEGQLPF